MLGQLGLHFFSVCDGHGLNGHHVSAYIKEALPSKFAFYFLFLVLVYIEK
jgi:serine/threonine protein phosphatase PrpC